MFTERQNEDEIVIDDSPKIIEDKGWDFSLGLIITDDIPTIECDFVDDGIMTDNIMAYGFNGLLFNKKVKYILDELQVDNVQYFKVRLKNTKSGKVNDDYILCNIIGLFDCLDYDRSSLRLNKHGRIRAIDSLTFIDTSKMELPPIFRLSSFLPLVIANDAIKLAFERERVTGFKFYKPEDFYL